MAVVLTSTRPGYDLIAVPELTPSTLDLDRLAKTSPPQIRLESNSAQNVVGRLPYLCMGRTKMERQMHKELRQRKRNSRQPTKHL